MNGIEIRAATREDMATVARLVAAEFTRSIASQYRLEGRRTFLAYAEETALRSRLELGHAETLVAEHPRDGLVGCIELRGNHVSLLFVAHDHQRRGIARTLLQQALATRGDAEITVHAAPSSRAAYERLGFAATGDPAVGNGIEFVPMARPGGQPARDACP